MSETESTPTFVESHEPTTVLDAYEAVMSLGEASVTGLAAQIWEELPPEAQRQIHMAACLIDPSIGGTTRCMRQLLIFAYVNRAPGEPFTPLQEDAA